MPLSKIKPGLTLLWWFVPLLVLLEIGAQWRIDNSVPSPEEWNAAAEAIRAQWDEGDLVVIAPSWATHGRMYLKDLISLRDFGRFDETTYSRIFEISVNGARSRETEGLTLKRSQAFEKLEVNLYTKGNRSEVIFDFQENSQLADVVDRGRPAPPRIVIDHWFNPRLVIPVELSRKAVKLAYSDVPLNGDIIRGYGIVGYRSGRFNKGGPITLSVFVGEELVGKHVVENFGPKGPFEFQIPAGLGKGQVRFEVSAGDGLDREFGFAADIRKSAGNVR